MGYSIRQRADIVGTFRFVSVFFMETLARWVPTTPELEAKALFGRHIWDLAQHADQLGQRTAELRASLHYSRAPIEAYQKVMHSIDALTDTVDRIATFYDVVLPHLLGEHKQYLENTDHLLDEPTVRVLERMVVDYPRMTAQRDELLKERPDLAPAKDQLAVAGLTAAIAKLDGIVDHRPVTAEAKS